MDPGKEGLSGQVAALKVLRDKPEVMKKPIDDLYAIVVEEFGKIDARIRPFFQIAKSYNSGTVEINYEDSWKDGKLGIPIFSIEDMYSGSNLFQDGMSQMGIIPTIAYDANIFISPGSGYDGRARTGDPGTRPHDHPRTRDADRDRLQRSRYLRIIRHRRGGHRPPRR